MLKSEECVPVVAVQEVGVAEILLSSRQTSTSSQLCGPEQLEANETERLKWKWGVEHARNVYHKKILQIMNRYCNSLTMTLLKKQQTKNKLLVHTLCRPWGKI